MMKKYKLGEVCIIIPGFAFQASDFGYGDNLVVKIKDINPPLINIEESERTIFQPDDRYRISNGDFVMAMTGATIGKIGRLDSDSTNVYINQRVCKFDIKETFCKDYVYYLLNTNTFKTFVHNNVDSKLAQPNIGHPTLYKFEYFFPSCKIQERIARTLNILDRKITLNRTINQNLPMPDRSLEVGEVRCAA